MFSLGKFIILILLLSACAPKQIKTTTEKQNIWQESAYLISNETKQSWMDIEKKSGIPSSILKRFNSSIAAKKRIIIPAKKIHQVKPGETAIAIAVQYGLTLSELDNLNDLNAKYTLLKEQNLKVIDAKLKIPKKTTKPAKLKFIWPADGEVIENFGKQANDKYNNEISLNANGDVKSAAEGIVVYIGNEVGNYGNLIIIQHQGDWFSSYGNLSEILIKKDDSIKAGQKIGTINTPPLYFGLRDGTNAVNPIKYLIRKK